MTMNLCRVKKKKIVGFAQRKYSMSIYKVIKQIGKVSGEIAILY